MFCVRDQALYQCALFSRCKWKVNGMIREGVERNKCVNDSACFPTPRTLLLFKRGWKFLFSQSHKSRVFGLRDRLSNYSEKEKEKSRSKKGKQNVSLSSRLFIRKWMRLNFTFCGARKETRKRNCAKSAATSKSICVTNILISFCAKKVEWYCGNRERLILSSTKCTS